MTAAKRKVLLADDTLFFRSALSELLEGEGWEVLQADDGRAALDVALRELPALDLLILDLQMPGRDGFGVLAEVRGREGGRKVPALILSGDTLRPEQRQRAHALGVRATLEKSIPLPEMAARIVRLLEPEGSGEEPRVSD